MSTTPKKTPSRARPSRSRAEVAARFEEIQRAPKSNLDPHSLEVSRQRTDTLRESFTELTPEAIAQQITSLQLATTRSLASIQESILEESTKLTDIREAVEAETEELARLHDLAVVGVSIEMLLEDYETKKAALEKQYADRQVTLDKNTQMLQENAANAAKALDLDRARERDAYEYKKGQERRASDDAFAQKQLLAERQFADKGEELKRSWAAMQDSLYKQEAELAERVKAFETTREQLVADMKKDAAAQLGAVTRDHKHLLEMTTANANAALALEKANSTALATQVTTLTNQLKASNEALDKAREQTAQTATKAFESMSGQAALNSVQQTLKDNGAQGRSGTSKS